MKRKYHVLSKKLELYTCNNKIRFLRFYAKHKKDILFIF